MFSFTDGSKSLRILEIDLAPSDFDLSSLKPFLLKTLSHLFENFEATYWRFHHPQGASSKPSAEC